MPAAAAAQVLPALLVRAAQHGETRWRAPRGGSPDTASTQLPRTRRHCRRSARPACRPSPVAPTAAALRARGCPRAGDVRAQEEGLKRTAAMAESLDYEGLKNAVLPALHALCLSTTSGGWVGGWVAAWVEGVPKGHLKGCMAACCAVGVAYCEGWEAAGTGAAATCGPATCVPCAAARDVSRTPRSPVHAPWPPPLLQAHCAFVSCAAPRLPNLRTLSLPPALLLHPLCCAPPRLPLLARPPAPSASRLCTPPPPCLSCRSRLACVHFCGHPAPPLPPTPTCALSPPPPPPPLQPPCA